MQAQGGKCIFSSEWNQYAQKTYMANFGDMPFGDITKEETKSYIPAHFDVLCAGFPCLPFSIAGVSQKTVLAVKTDSRTKRKEPFSSMWLTLSADIALRHSFSTFWVGSDRRELLWPTLTLPPPGRRFCPHFRGTSRRMI